MQAFPETGSARFHALGFHAGLNLMQTFPVAAALEIAIFVFGTKAAAAGDSAGVQKAVKVE